MDSKFYSILSLLAYCNPKDFGGNLAISGNAKQKLIGILNEIKKGEYCAEYKDIANNWSVVDVESIPGTGFKAIALGRDLNGDGIYDNVVISYAGTDSLADYGEDALLALTGLNNQMSYAALFYLEIINLDNCKNANISFTGHSLYGYGGDDVLMGYGGDDMLKGGKAMIF